VLPNGLEPGIHTLLNRHYRTTAIGALSAGGGLLLGMYLAEAMLLGPAMWQIGEALVAPVLIAALCAIAFSTRTVWDRRDPASVAAGILDSMRPDLGTHGVALGVLGELLRLSQAREVVVALEQRGGGVLVVRLKDDACDESDVDVVRLSPADRDTYLFAWPTEPATGPSPHEGGDREMRIRLDRDMGVRAVAALRDFTPPGFRAAHKCERLYAIRFRHRSEWRGRVFLLDPAHRDDHELFLKGFERMLTELLPPVAAACDLHGLRKRAAAQERARLGRELHDGVVQGLLAIEMQLEVLRRGVSQQSGTAVGEKLEQLQHGLRGEVRGLRALLQRARSYDVEPSELPGVLADIVRRFERESGIVSDYASEVHELSLPRRVCGEIVRILQEALVNVQRHSGAGEVLVRFSCEHDRLRLSIQDDGRGFQASAGHTSAFAAMRVVRPPAVIHERVHSIGGTVQVAPARRGARLEITLPRKGPWTSIASFES
jgi:signal transduction histidine kinase